MASEGPNLCTGAADNSTVGSITWSNPSNITLDDGSYATAALVLLNDQSHYLEGNTFGFAVPAGSTIDGVQFEFELKKSAFGGTTTIVSAKALIGGSYGDEKSASETLDTTDTWYSFGGSTDTHGLSLTATNINAAGCSCVVSVQLSPTPAATISCDACRMTVWYTPASGPPTRVTMASRPVHFAEIFE